MKKYKMRNFLQITLILLLFMSCYTVKIAQKQLIRANVTYPLTTADYFIKTYPIKDSIVEKVKFIKGNDVIKYDTIKEIDCDSIVNDTIINNKVLIRYKNIYRTDTLFKEKLVYQKSTAEIELINLLRAKILSLNQDLEDETNNKRKYRNSFFLLLGILLLGLYFKLK